MEDYTPLDDNIFVPCNDDEPISVSVDQVAVDQADKCVSRRWSWQLTKLGAQNVLRYSCPGFNGSQLNQSFEKSKVPREWKLADVLPLPKGKSMED